MNFNNIEEFLRNGGTPEQIADAFTKELNAAINNLSHEKEIQNKATIVADSWNDFMNTYIQDHSLPDNITIKDFYVNSDNMIELADTIVKLIPFVVKYAPVLENISDGTEELSNKIQSKNLENLDDFDFQNLISSFLDETNN